MSGRRLAACVAGALWAWGGHAAGQASDHTILLVGARVFSGGERVVELLNDIAAVTDVVGASRFELVTGEGGPQDFPSWLDGHGRVRAVLAVVGDLSVLDGVDPSLPAGHQDWITSRRVDRDALDEQLVALQAAADALGAELVLATAPLGKQGRIETPELLDVADHLRARGPILDLAAPFADLEEATLFSNGIDRLDDYGHDELARAIFAALIAQDGDDRLFPPIDEAERAARLQAAALQALVQGRAEDFVNFTDRALARPPDSVRHAARQAALASARHGISSVRDRWSAIEDVERDVPGLGVGRSLATLSLSSARPSDPVEAGILATFAAMAEGGLGSSAPRDLMSATVDEHPHRLDAWVAYQLMAAVTFPRRDVRGYARVTLKQYGRAPVSLAVADQLLLAWPATVDALPALLAASRPFALMAPTGPKLDKARRRALYGYRKSAVWLLEHTLPDDARFPPSWRAELERIRTTLDEPR